MSESIGNSGSGMKLHTKILLGLVHQPADHGFQIIILRAILRRDDEAELMPI